jgi:hypothetical protein
LNTGTVTGQVVLTFDGTDTGNHGMPILRVNGVALRTACDSRDAVFRGGPRNGFTGAGAVPTPGECLPNDFALRVSCVCKFLDGWQGAGIYCVDQGDGCEPLELFDVDEDRCADAGHTICSGPYATLELAEAACGPVVTDCCPGGVPATLYFHLSNCSNGAHPLNNQTYAATYQTIDSVAAWWVQSGVSGGSCAAGEDLYEWFLWCDAGAWSIESRAGYCGLIASGFGVTCGPPFSASITGATVYLGVGGETIDILVNATP